MMSAYLAALTRRLLAWPRQIRFLMAGGINTLFGLAVYPLLLWSLPAFHRHYLVALLIAQGICTIIAFITYKLGVFRNGSDAVMREIGAFSSFYIANYAVNLAVLPVLVEWGRLSPIVAQLGFSAVVMVASYFWHSLITFRSAEQPQ